MQFSYNAVSSSHIGMSNGVFVVSEITDVHSSPKVMAVFVQDQN